MQRIWVSSCGQATNRFRICGEVFRMLDRLGDVCPVALGQVGSLVAMLPVSWRLQLTFPYQRLDQSPFTEGSVA